MIPTSQIPRFILYTLSSLLYGTRIEEVVWRRNEQLPKLQASSGPSGVYVRPILFMSVGTAGGDIRKGHQMVAVTY